MIEAEVVFQHHDACDGGVLTAKGFVVVTRDAEVMFFFVRIVIVALDTGLPVRGGGDEKVNERFDGKWRKSGG